MRDVQACTIGLSINENIKLRTRRRLRKGYIYIHSAKSLPEPLTRVRNSAVTENGLARLIYIIVYSKIGG